MDTRKVTLIATIAAIALVAVGIGYAYTASTQNAQNSATTEYVTLVQGDGTSAMGAYQFADENTRVFWDTTDGVESSDFVTTFKLSATTDTTTLSGYTLAPIGKSFQLITTMQNPRSNVGNLTGVLTSTGIAAPFVGDVDSAVFIKITTDANTDFYKVFSNNVIQKKVGSTFTGDNTFTIYEDATNGTYKTASVTVYYGYSGNAGVKVTHDKGVPPTGPSTAPLTSASLTFTLFNDGTNGGSTEVTEITVSPTAVSVAAGADSAVTPTIAPSNASNKAIVCKSSDASVAVAVVSADYSSITVYGLKEGSATIAVMTIDGSQTATINVTVTAS
ncbi:MAG: Ig-like domain-containing protein [Candidatus Methanomethylophilaceae archaeon]|nr:Ig-like domain-containing protein [Candidatus Methanomethylophilaceae archaeon]